MVARISLGFPQGLLVQEFLLCGLYWGLKRASALLLKDEPKDEMHERELPVYYFSSFFFFFPFFKLTLWYTIWYKTAVQTHFKSV